MTKYRLKIEISQYGKVIETKFVEVELIIPPKIGSGWKTLMTNNNIHTKIVDIKEIKN